MTLQELEDFVAVQVSSQRFEAGWTQAQLAKRAGMTQSRIAEIESGRRGALNLRTIVRLASAFGLEVDMRWVSKWPANVR